jgi:hypothetical protein
VGGYFAASDGFQHVIVATQSGDVHEVFFKGGGQSIGEDRLAQFEAIVGAPGYLAGAGVAGTLTAAKPMDLVWGEVDDNGLPLNPQWQYQIDHARPGIESGVSNTLSCGANGGATCPYPNVPQLCDVQDPHLVGCTAQNVTSNTQPNTWINAGCNWPKVSSAFTSGLFAGHKNWFPVTVTGALVLDAGYDDSWSAQQGIGWDADLDFYLRPTIPSQGPEGRGLTLASVLEKGAQIGPEWDGYEALFDRGDSNSWWNRFFKFRNTNADPSNTAKKMVNPEFPNAPTAGAGVQNARDDSVVIGLLGLDCRHECHAELHPTYAMAIHTQASQSDDRWSVFARNWGNEGSCGSLQELVAMQSFSMRLRHPFATGVRIDTNDFVGRAGRYDQGVSILNAPTVGWNLSSTIVGSGTSEAAAILTITLPPPEARAVVLGELALTWTESSPVATRPRPPFAMSQLPRKATGGSRDDEHVEALIERMTPEQRKIFLANAPKPKPAVPMVATKIPQDSRLIPVKVEDLRKISRSVEDPEQAVHMVQFYKATCTAFDDKLPGLPDLCSTIKPGSGTQITPIKASPAMLEFLPVTVGPLFVTIMNTSGAQITLGVPALVGAQASDFTIDAGCREISLSPKATCKIAVAFRAGGVGQRGAQLDIPVSGGLRGTKVDLSGPGLIP